MKKKYLAYISSVYIFLVILGLKSEYCEKQSLELDYLNEFSSNENNYTPHTLFISLSQSSWSEHKEYKLNYYMGTLRIINLTSSNNNTLIQHFTTNKSRL